MSTDLRRETVLALEAMGIGVEYSHHEVAPSQHEIDLRYTDALTMADNAMTYRLVVKEVARKHGVYATFMPKPLSGENGSGMHTHQSLFTGDSNAFFDPTDELHLSKTARSYIAGLMKYAPEIILVTQPVGQLLQAPGAWLRGPGLHLLGAAEPLGHDPRPRVPARQGEGHPHRVPLRRTLPATPTWPSPPCWPQA